MYDSGPVERPYKAENTAETKGYDPAGNGAGRAQAGLNEPAALNQCDRATPRRWAPTCARRAPEGAGVRESRSDPSCRRCSQRPRAPDRSCRVQLRRPPRDRDVPSA